MFNPRLLVDRRRTAQRQLKEIDAFVRRLNRKLAEPTSRRSRDSIAGAVHRKLASYNLVSAFDVKIRKRDVGGRSRFRVNVQLDERQWRHRQRYDGFNILVADPGITHSPAELARLYRQKDQVEKGFQTIKSVLELRPVRHQTDHKLRAHVTVCMLALHLLRTLDARLGSERTAGTALETLATCHLNLYEPADAELTAFAITRPNPEQCAILDALGLRRLARDQEITNSIIPRS
jgi:transposase